MSAQQQYGWYWFEKIVNLFSEQPAERGFLLGVLVVCGIASVVLSGWCIYIDNVINNDGVEYIRTAERLAVADWAGALSAYKWPFFPFLILLSSKILALSYSTTGYLLNTIFFTITIVFFVLTVREFGGYSRRLTLLAATVALVHPAFNEYRAFIIRDSGYLASLLVAMYCLARVGKVDFLKYRAGVVAGFAVASLFRVEGFVFLLFTPLLLAVIRGQHNVSPWRMLLTVVVSAGLLLAVAGCWLRPYLCGSVNDLSILENPLEVVTLAWEQIGGNVALKLNILRDEFLGEYSSKYTFVLYGFTVLMIMTSAALLLLTAPWTLLVVHTLFIRLGFPSAATTRLWITLLCIHLLVLGVGAGLMVYLKPRYELAFIVTLLLIVPFALEKLVSHSYWKKLSRVRRILLSLLLLWGVGEGVSGLDNVTRSLAMKEAGIWLADKTTVAGSLVTNDRRIAFYAGRHHEKSHIVNETSQILIGLKKGRWSYSQFVAIRLKRRDTENEAWVRDALGSQPLKEFTQLKGDKVLLYRIR